MAGVTQSSLESGEVGVVAETLGEEDSPCDSHFPSPLP